MHIALVTIAENTFHTCQILESMQFDSKAKLKHLMLAVLSKVEAFPAVAGLVGVVQDAVEEYDVEICDCSWMD